VQTLRRLTIPIRNLEIRNEASRKIGGLAIPINQPVDVLPNLKEVWLPGSISYHERGVRLLLLHNPSTPLCSTVSGKLSLELRDDGLHFEAELPNTTLGNDCLELVRTGELYGVSPGFVCDDSKWSYSDKYDLRQIVKCRVSEISLTNIPAYPATYVEQRNEVLDAAVLDQIKMRKGVLDSLRKSQLSLSRQATMESLRK
jgi:HK97 family phage prohead protease